MSTVTAESLIGVKRITFRAPITVERDERGFWVATAWQSGLPVARRPIDEQTVIDLCNTNQPSFFFA